MMLLHLLPISLSLVQANAVCDPSVLSGFAASTCINGQSGCCGNENIQYTLQAPPFDTSLYNNGQDVYYYWVACSPNGSFVWAVNDAASFVPEVINVNRIWSAAVGFLPPVYYVQRFASQFQCGQPCEPFGDFFPIGPVTVCSGYPMDTSEPTALPTWIPSMIPSAIPTVNPSTDCSGIGSFADCEWYIRCLKESYDCTLDAYSICIELNVMIMDNVISSDSALWMKSIIQCEKKGVAEFISDQTSKTCGSLQHYSHSRQIACYLQDHSYTLFCSLPMDDIITISQVENINNDIMSCNGNFIDDWEFFLLTLDNDELKPIFDIGVDVMKVGWVLLSASTCLTRGGLMDAASGGTSVLCLGTFINDIPNLYEDVVNDLERVGMYVLDTYEGSIAISFAVRSGISVAETLTEEITNLYGKHFIFNDQEYGNFSFGVRNFVEQAEKIVTTNYFTTVWKTDADPTHTSQTQITNSINESSCQWIFVTTHFIYGFIIFSMI